MPAEFANASRADMDEDPQDGLRVVDVVLHEMHDIAGKLTMAAGQDLAAAWEGNFEICVSYVNM